MEMIDRILENLEMMNAELSAKSSELNAKRDQMGDIHWLRKRSELNGQQTMYIKVTTMILAEMRNIQG